MAQSSSKAPRKPRRDGILTRQRVIAQAGVGKSSPQISREIGISEARVRQILAEPDVATTVEQYRTDLVKRQITAEGALIAKLVEKLDTPEWRDAADRLELRLSNIARFHIDLAAASAPKSPTHAIQVNNTMQAPVSFEELLKEFQQVPADE